MSSEEDEYVETAAEQKWRTWSKFTRQDAEYSSAGSDTDDEVQFGQVRRQVELDETIDKEIEQELAEEMAAQQQQDMAALLAQLTAANLALNQRELDRDARAVVAVALSERRHYQSTGGKDRKVHW